MPLGGDAIVELESLRVTLRQLRVFLLRPIVDRVVEKVAAVVDVTGSREAAAAIRGWVEPEPGPEPRWPATATAGLPMVGEPYPHPDANT